VSLLILCSPFFLGLTKYVLIGSSRINFAAVTMQYRFAALLTCLSHHVLNSFRQAGGCDVSPWRMGETPQKIRRYLPYL